jgi:peptidoglycan/LPS O-acetylase OafA/YrhL
LARLPVAGIVTGPERAGKERRRGGIVGVFRVLLAISVVIGHSHGYPPHLGFLNAYYSVQLFFVVSGFYMAFVIDTKYGKQAGGTRQFYLNRIFRLLPTYLFVLFTYSLIVYCLRRAGSTPHFGWWSHYHTLFGNNHIIVFSYLVVSNLCMVGLDIAPFFSINGVSAHDYTVIPPAWSIGMELCFYLLAPWLVRAKLKTLVSLLCVSSLIRIGLISFRSHLPPGPWEPPGQRILLTELAYFVLGIISYKYIYKNLIKIEKRKTMRVYMFVSLAGSVLVACFSGVTLYADRPWQTCFQSAYLSLATALMIPGLFSLTRRSTVDRFVGYFSYPLYLTHYPVICLFGKDILGVNFGLNILILSVLASSAVVLLIEIPVENWRTKVLQSTSIMAKKVAPSFAHAA